MNKIEELKDHYTQMKSEREKYKDRFKAISNLVNLTGIDNNPAMQGQEIAKYINDSTAYQSMIQSARSFIGILWNGKGTFKMLPVEDLRDDPEEDFEENISKFYEDVTDKVASQMDDCNSGLSKAFERYGNAFQSVGNGGIGVYLNNDFINGNADNALEFRFYGVNNTCIDEGAGGMIEYVYSEYNWNISKIVRTFAYNGDTLDETEFAKLPESWRRSYKNKKYTDKYKFVHAFEPNEKYVRGKKGKIGSKYVGYFFSPDDNVIFHEEYYEKRQICFVRDILINDEIYGRAQGTVLLPAIEMLNYIMGTAIENIEKMTDPAFGILDGLLTKDKIIDTSAGSVTPINPIDMHGNAPTFPIQDVGDISALVSFLIPMLREEIIKGFDVDILMDINSSKQMTAQEFIGRLKLRAEGLRNRLKANLENLMLPLIEASANLCIIAKIIKEEDIPEKVLEKINEGKQWYKIKFMNDLGRLTNVDLVDGINKLMMLMAQLAAFDPLIVKKLDLEQIVDKVNEYLANDETLLLTDMQYSDIKKQYEQAQANAAKMNEDNINSQTLKNVSESTKDGDKSSQQFGW